MIIAWDCAPTGSPPTPNKDVLDFGDFVKEAAIALDKTLTGESGEITVHDRRIKFKAKWHVHSFDELIVWNAKAQDIYGDRYPSQSKAL